VSAVSKDDAAERFKRKYSLQSDDSAYRTAERGNSGRSSSQSHATSNTNTTMSRPTSAELNSILDKNKIDIRKKLKDIRDTQINVQLEGKC
jgi:hypothetical protein